jgi:CRISPR/Cas system-associated exonuclease Cas4 (RecB family)
MNAVVAPPVAPPPPPESPQVSQRELISQLQQTVSASRLSCWLSCRLKFYFRYVLRLSKSPTAALHVGSVVHTVLQQWNLDRWRRQPFETKRMKELFDKRWPEQGKINWEGEEENDKKQAWSLLETYFIETPIKSDEKPQAVEVAVEADLGKYGLPQLIGIIDLVRAGGRIVDFKTCGQTPNPEKAAHQHEVQTSAYAVLYRDCTEKKEQGIELHHLVKLKQPKLVVTPLPPMTSQKETRLFKLMESYVSGLDREDFVPSPGLQCMACEYFNECRRHS